MLNKIKPPLWLLLELTYKCPLACPYCYNDLKFANTKDSMSTADWFRVMEEAREMGAVQIGFSGGEPLLNKDIIKIVQKASDLKFYTNLITSGVGMKKNIMHELKEAGLKTVQLSIQSHDEKTLNYIAHHENAYKEKIKALKEIKDAKLQLIINVCITKQNIHQLRDIIDFSEKAGADYLEIANVQYYGWALENMEALLPTEKQLDDAKKVTDNYRKTVDKIKVFFIVPDYYASRPKACMNGWGDTFLTINPQGDALPCNAANSLPIEFPNVKNDSIEEIWNNSKAFNFFRGYEWMKEPCRSCDEKEKDFGGCRCQAYALTQDIYATDPVCSKSSDNDLILKSIEKSKTSSKELIFRTRKNSLLYV